VVWGWGVWLGGVSLFMGDFCCAGRVCWDVVCSVLFRSGDEKSVSGLVQIFKSSSKLYLCVVRYLGLLV